MRGYPDAERRVPFMRDVRHERFGEHAGAQVLWLPFGEGATTMLFVLPKSRGRGALDALVASVMDASVAAYEALLTRRVVAMELPRFHCETSVSMEGAMGAAEATGAGIAFTPDAADFFGMDGSRYLYISAILHRAVVAVDASGAEVAAVTATVMRAGALPGKEDVETPLPFVADRPFLFLFRNR